MRLKSYSKNISIYSLATTFLLVFLLLDKISIAQAKTIQLYKGSAPGSDNWTWNERETMAGSPMNAKIVSNVTSPSLVIFEPDTANGTAIIICPGGSYHVLNIEHEGTKIANQLTKKGITIFLFKYRLVRSVTDDPWQEMMESRKNSASLQQKMAPLREMAITDLSTAIGYLRQHANEYKIDPSRIGVMGFSAGGLLVANLAYNFTPENKPNFVAAIYATIQNIKERVVKEDAPPLFIAAATDDSLAGVSNSVSLYTDWVNAKKSAELHLYAKGAHGLRPAPAFTWINRFEDWLYAQEFLKVR